MALADCLHVVAATCDWACKSVVQESSIMNAPNKVFMLMFINVFCYYVRCKGNEVFRMEEYRIMGYINQINGKGFCNAQLPLLGSGSVLLGSRCNHL